MGRYPVYVTTLLVGVHVACAVLACFVMAFGAGSVLDLFLFDSAFVLQAGQLWRLLTYAFVHSPSGLLWFAIEMYMLFIFGREVERFVGRRAFIVLYAALLLAPTLVLSIWGFRERTGLAGSPAIHMGVFIAFATIYPHVELLLRIMAKWVALGLAGINTLMLLADRAWPNVAVLWVSIFVAFFFIRLRGVGPELVWWESIKTIVRPKPKFHVVPRPTARRVVEPDNVHDSIDPVLDKISKHGINSLTPTERRTLDRARARLLNKTK